MSCILEALLEGISERYKLAGVSLRSLNSASGKHIYRVEQASGGYGILRVYEADQIQALRNLAAILSFFEEKRYPAERIVRATHGDSIVTLAGRQLLMTTCISGQKPDYSLPSLFALGSALGRLHALCDSLLLSEKEKLPLAEMLPAREISYALSQLYGVKSRLSRDQFARYDRLMTALHIIDIREDLPVMLIHNDCHPGNAMLTPSNEMVFIDWDGAGLGPASIDVGFLLSSCDTESPWTPPLPPDPARVNTVIDGYCQHHMLSRADLEFLPDAIRFRALVYGAGSFAAAVREGHEEDSSDWWWKRCTSAEDIAGHAVQRFEHW